FLDEQSGDEEADVNQWDALGHVEYCVAKGKAEVLLLEGGAEFACDRFGRFLGNHFEAGGEGVACAHSAAPKIQCFGKMLLKFAQALLAEPGHVRERETDYNEADKYGSPELGIGVTDK